MSHRILVIESEEAARRNIVSILTAAGYECREAGDGLEAVDLLGSGQRFDLVLSELLMPNLDGLQLLEYLNDKCPGIPVVILTAVDDIQVALQALRNGAYDYLLKPFQQEQLLAAVQRALETRRLKLENDAYRSSLETLVAERAQKFKDSLINLQKSYDLTLETLGDALDLKDSETDGHSKRVTAYTIAIARRMGLPKDEINIIARGAFLHDIGKMAIRDDVLFKPGKLTPEEMAIMKEHAYLGYQIVAKIPFLTEAADIVYCHQEHYDGSGYPRGLRGEEIPLGARIVAIADTLDSITSDLPYRRAQSFEIARSEIKDWSGRQFDPQIVQAFLEIPNELWKDLAKDIARQSS